MARRTPLRAICVVATATVASGFLSPSCGQHCGGSPSSFAATPSATHVASRRCTGSAWRPAAVPARTTRLGDLQMVGRRHAVRILVVFLSLFGPRCQHPINILQSGPWGTSATAVYAAVFVKPPRLRPSCMPHSCFLCVLLPVWLDYSVGFGGHGHHHQRPEGGTRRGGVDTQRCVGYVKNTFATGIQSLLCCLSRPFAARNTAGVVAVSCTREYVRYGGFLGTTEVYGLRIAHALPQLDKKWRSFIQSPSYHINVASQARRLQQPSCTWAVVHGLGSRSPGAVTAKIWPTSVCLTWYPAVLFDS